MERILGKIEGNLPGPLIICIAGLHGNEQVGLHAFRNVCSAIEKHNIPFKGKMVGICGNTRAIESNRRYIDYDLNRVWDEPRIKEILSKEEHFLSEDKELIEIYQVIDTESKGDFEQKVMVDLHSTSSDKGNFLVVPEDESTHPILSELHLPVVLGLDSYVKGTLLSYYHEKGFLSFAFEGGMMGTEDVYQLHTSGLWQILEKSGGVTEHDHEKEDHYKNQLMEVSSTLPQRVKVLHREYVQPQDRFRMLPGFHNFQSVHKDQLLAINKNGHITSPMDGMIFMPLYQPEGDDGFFIVEEVN